MINLVCKNMLLSGVLSDATYSVPTAGPAV